MIQFFMPMIPPTVTAQEKDIGKNRKTGKAFLHNTDEIKEAKKKLTAYLWQHRPEKPYQGGVRLIVKWCFPRGKHRDGEYRTTKPDTDNLEKLLKDCMTRCGFWKDDAQVASEICEKFWAEITGIWIHIEELGEREMMPDKLIAIKGFRIPETCISCPMQFGGWCGVAPPEVDERVAETVEEAWQQKRPQWCPLIEVEAARNA